MNVGKIRKKIKDDLLWNKNKKTIKKIGRNKRDRFKEDREKA